MQIKYLGHSGFYVETAHAIILMDPWFSTAGAFDSAWFQYPRNHHLAEIIRNDFSHSTKEKFIYISHEHKDHFDIEFLLSLPNRDFTLVLADFFHPIVHDDLMKANYQCQAIVTLQHQESLVFQDGVITLFVIDMELDADSAILVQSNTGTFLNLNDSKPHDQLHAIAERYGPIDVLSGQFSGAIWHPTCYTMPEYEYEAVCNSKNHNKFTLIVQSLETLKPAVFLPSAGPPCFLDPQLFPIQLQPVNTYPRARQLLDFLDEHFSANPIATEWSEIMPGDVFDVKNKAFSERCPIRVEDHDFIPYITKYAKEYEPFFKAREQANQLIEPEVVFQELEAELILKLNSMHLMRHSIQTLLYIGLDDYPGCFYCVNFQNNTVSITSAIEDSSPFFMMSAPAWQIAKVLSREISWADFSLTFRATLQRVPDVYNTLSHAYLTLNHDRLEHFCQLYHDIMFKKERIVVHCDKKSYSILRFCPHQGGDLATAPIQDGILTCPRHSWKFDLKNGGRCLHNPMSIEAIPQDVID